MKQTKEQADRSEHTARELCGKLGPVERKRRQGCLDTMGLISNELGVMKRQMRDKNRMVQTLSDRVEALVHNFEDVHHQMAEMTARQVASNIKLDAISDLLMQLVNRRN